MLLALLRGGCDCVWPEVQYILLNFQVVITVCCGHFSGLYCMMVAIDLRTRSLGETMLEFCVMNFCHMEEMPSHPKSLRFPMYVNASHTAASANLSRACVNVCVFCCLRITNASISCYFTKHFSEACIPCTCFPGG